jgi:hypothetical protein|tara:strand:- start:834 stop:1139 length:306 start_codon:yes stop_codon:yes gene_type:complete
MQLQKNIIEWNTDKTYTFIDVWRCEKWVMIIPFLKSGRVVDCKRELRYKKACLPIKRINHATPITLPELLKLYSKNDILEMARKKNKNMGKLVNWHKLEFY